MLRHGNPTQSDNLPDLLLPRVSALVREIEEAGWHAGDVAHAIRAIVEEHWLSTARALDGVRATLPEDFVSDGNEG